MLETIKQVQARSRCIFDETRVEAALDQLAINITARLAERNPVVLCVMNGAIVTVGKLVTRLRFPLQIDYIHATRYRNKTSGGQLEWKAHPTLSLKDRSVLIVDDILDEGLTLEQIVAYCQQAGANEVLTAVLVNKKLESKKSGIKADFVALETGNHYLFGYGMDYKGYLRNAPGIFAVDDADTET